MTRSHSPTCEADGAHDGDCATATELARLRAFAEAVRDEIGCSDDNRPAYYAEAEDHVDDCWHCAALQALERAR